jgi:creatinine amidohydrolase
MIPASRLGSEGVDEQVTPHRWSEANWPDLDRAAGLVAILPVGAVEAHGPHLPTGTDCLIAEAMADEAARRLEARGVRSSVLPTLAYTAAPFASGFRGTISIRPTTATALIVDIGRAVAAQNARALAIANAHFDPANLESIQAAVESLASHTALPVVFPDLTRKPWALRLTAEFRSGACHAGQYEGSVVLATRPDLVDESRRAGLPANPTSLSDAIRAGKRSFEESGGSEAYFGDPVAASAAEGYETVKILGAILEEAVIAEVGDD